MSKIVIKIGSLVLTREDGQLNKKAISNLVSDVALLVKKKYKIVIISSGAVSSGRFNDVLKSKFRVQSFSQDPDIMRKQILASVGQPKLISFYSQEFAKHNLVCAQILVTQADFSSPKRYSSLILVIKNLLALNIIPIINENDVLSDEELVFSDNDQLSCLAAKMINASKLILLTNVNGVYDRSPKEKDAKLVPEIINIKQAFGYIGEEKSSAGRGGMRSKLGCAMEAVNFGINVYVGSGLKPRAVSRILGSEKEGTFLPAKK